jgi:hypothetical protein
MVLTGRVVAALWASGATVVCCVEAVAHVHWVAVGPLAIRRLGRRVGCTVPHGTMCPGQHGYCATGPCAEVGPNGRVYLVSFRFRFKYAANFKNW